MLLLVLDCRPGRRFEVTGRREGAPSVAFSGIHLEIRS